MNFEDALGDGLNFFMALGGWLRGRCPNEDGFWEVSEHHLEACRFEGMVRRHLRDRLSPPQMHDPLHGGQPWSSVRHDGMGLALHSHDNFQSIDTIQVSLQTFASWDRIASLWVNW